MFQTRSCCGSSPSAAPPWDQPTWRRCEALPRSCRFPNGSTRGRMSVADACQVPAPRHRQPDMEAVRAVPLPDVGGQAVCLAGHCPDSTGRDMQEMRQAAPSEFSLGAIHVPDAALQVARACVWYALVPRRLLIHHCRVYTSRRDLGSEWCSLEGACPGLPDRVCSERPGITPHPAHAHWNTL